MFVRLIPSIISHTTKGFPIYDISVTHKTLFRIIKTTVENSSTAYNLIRNDTDQSKVKNQWGEIKNVSVIATFAEIVHTEEKYPIINYFCTACSF